MKQGNGTDVLGLNDPRNASIGVIYVSPNDEKKSVLAAILTQEKLGRKQVAVVLPDQNKAFQRPGDFDDLKSLRGKLQTRIVFIATGGPGPAAFARQRNFPVYSSLEIFAKALKDEEQNPSENKKGGWLFGTGRQKSASLPPAEPVKPEVTPAGTYIAPLSGEEEPVSHNDSIVPLVLGGAEVAGAAAIANGNGYANAPKDSTISSSPLDDDWDALAPMPVASAAATPEAVSAKNGSNGSNNGHSAESEEGEGSPGIILLAPTRGRATVKFPVAKDNEPSVPPVVIPVAKSAQQAPPQRATKQRNSGKVAAAVATGAAGSLAAASLARTAGVGNAPPPRVVPQGGGGGGRPRRRGALIAALIALLLLTTIVVGGIAISAPSLFAPLKSIVPKFTAQSTVNIVPDSKTENNNYLISGVTNNPDATKREVSARVVVGTSPSQSKTVNATGVKQTPATAAKGTITFYNSQPNAQFVGVVVFTLPSGVKFENDAGVSIPSANLPVTGSKTVSAHAITTGTVGNINAKAFDGACCTTGVEAINGAFSGGQDPQNYTFVQASDIQGAVNVLEPPLVVQAQNSLKTQIKSNEQVAGSTMCSPSIAQSQNPGDKASSVAVTVSVTCKAEVYDQKGTLALVSDLLKTKATNDYGPNYALVGNIVTQAQVQGVNKGVVSLLVSAKGVWAYSFTNARQLELKKLIAGKSVSDAATILKSQQGIANVSFDPNSGTLPGNTDDINFVIQTVTGLSGGGGTSGGGNLTPTVTGPGTNPTTQPGLGVGGGS